MFTGLIREIGDVTHYDNRTLCIRSSLRPKLGDSIAVNGVCLTVVRLNDKGFCVEVGDETRSIVPPEKFQGRVHLEPAMRLSDRFEGHVVQGHVDAVGTVVSITPKRTTVDIVIRTDADTLTYVAPKGSVAIDGVSLTVNDVYDDAFRLSIIPHTLKETLMGTYRIGGKVNIETDLFARYLAHILQRKGNKTKPLSWAEADAIVMGF